MTAIVSMDLEAGDAAVQTLRSTRDEIESLVQALTQSQSELVATWNGSSRSQFEGNWEHFTTSASTAMQTLEGLASGLAREVDELRQAAAAYGD